MVLSTYLSERVPGHQQHRVIKDHFADTLITSPLNTALNGLNRS